MSASAFRAVPQEAFGLSMFREGRHGEGIRYSAVTFPANPYQGVERMVRTARKLGMISDLTSSYPGAYAVLDVLDREGDILTDYAVLEASGFRYLKRKLNLVVEDRDRAVSVVPEEDVDEQA